MNEQIKFEWDEVKRLANIRKHGIDFLDAPEVFAGETLTIKDIRFDYCETRYVTMGLLKGRVVVIAHTERADRIRIISARKATRNEELAFFQQFTD
jgi:uncharacterized DUF497 family protein